MLTTRAGRMRSVTQRRVIRAPRSRTASRVRGVTANATRTRAARRSSVMRGRDAASGSVVTVAIVAFGRFGSPVEGELSSYRLLDDETVSGAEVSRLIRVANGTEPDVPSPSQPHHGSPGVPVHGHVPGSQNPGALPSPPPLPPHLNPGGGMARGISPDRT